MFSGAQRKKKLLSFWRIAFRNFRKWETMKLQRTECECPLKESIAWVLYKKW